MTSQFKSLFEVLDFFKDEATCKSYLAKARWGDTPACPHCGNVGAYVTNRGYKCKAKECGKKFSVTTLTIFENTKISLRIWFAAMYLCTAHRKGISSLQLSRDLNITQKTAWFLLHRIREMLNDWSEDEKLSGTVEIDETYVGGALKNKSNKKRRAIRHKNEQWGGVKTAVFALVEREGKVRTVMLDNKKAKLRDILPIIEAHVDKDALICTDSSSMYGSLKKTYKHEQVNHVQHEYVRGNVHTNTIEGFFSQLKRGVIGIYHYVSPKHLHRYCREFEYRYNNRLIRDTERFELSVRNCNNIRLPYKILISK